MRNYVSRYATMYRYKWRPDTKHSASELKRSSWVQYIKHWLISSTTHMRALISSPQSCTHADASGQRSMFATTLGTFAAGLRTIQSSTHWEKKYDTAWGIEKLVVTTEAPCSVQNNGHITFWSFKKFQALLGEYHRLSLWIIGASQSFSQVANRFERSVEAISWKFIKVLDSGNLLAKDLIKQETESSIN